MNTINFISGGKLGDFIHTMYAVKNICDREKALANVYITDRRGDIWTHGIDKAYDDLYELIISQPYVNTFVRDDGTIKEFIDLNTWRDDVATTHSLLGRYNTCWSELLSKKYRFSIPCKSVWMGVDKRNIEFEGCVIIHKSIGHPGSLPWDKIFKMPCKEFVFITSKVAEWDVFKYKDKTRVHSICSVAEMAIILASCKLFVGNQSAPLALASALDVPRIAELNHDPAAFYMGEERHTDNLMWYLNDKKHYIKF